MTGHSGLRLTPRAFTDLGLWMLGLGLVLGLTFPFALLALDVPTELALRLPVFVATVTAGLVLAAVNHRLATWVVGRRLRTLSRQMRHVSVVIAEAAFSGDWSGCSPQECELPVDSEDELGDSARSFNELVAALASSQAVQRALAEHNETMARHLELETLAGATVRSFVAAGAADAGALCIVRDGDLTQVASWRLGGGDLAGSAMIAAVMADGAPAWVDVPPDVLIDAAAVAFRPATIGILPLHFRSVPIGVLLVGYATRPSAGSVRLLESFRSPTAVAINNALSHERFQRLAAIDPLTGAYNRRFGLARLDEEWSRSLRSHTPLGLLAFDLDHFKAVNDTYGHLVGDRVLRDSTAAARLVIREGDVLIRTGGEEFLVILPGGGVDDVRAVGERLRRAVASLDTAVGDVRVKVTVSLGAASFPAVQVDSPEELVARADEALYISKRNGRDRLTSSTDVLPGAPTPSGEPARQTA